MFELLPGVGVVLPHNAGVLRFGMSEERAQWVLSTIADVRGYWSCGGRGVDDGHREHWSFGARLGALDIDVTGSEHGCRNITFAREGGLTVDPVVWRDVDVFGYPAAEVEAALPPPAEREELGLYLFPGTPGLPSAPEATAQSHMARVRLTTEDRSARRMY
ncbi:hypothetical protein [Embleya sp. NBC_00896]|uniref:hypothetical protein n=1 Tax=Embleya sp. NBC_00896 TaxID=2975961 RepID=UPI0038703C9E|nr:hypothetical protein OG928_05205 [Embleya sp. NBC_00896]